MTTRFSPALPLLIGGALLLAATPSGAQLLGGVLGQPGRAVGQTVGSITGPLLGAPGGGDAPRRTPIGSTLSSVAGVVPPTLNPTGLLDLRALRLTQLVAANSRVLERDERGQPVRRGVIVVINPDFAAIAAAERLGLRKIGDVVEPELGLRMLTFAAPGNVKLRKSLARLREAAPGIEADYDHVYEPAGGGLAPALGVALASAPSLRPGTRIAMIDGGVASHPSLAQAAISQKGFAGAAAATGHGTAVASLLVGSDGVFRGAARGASLFVGDIYGGNPAAGSASAIVRALAWAASKQPSVITLSLVGPANRALGGAVAALQRRGIAIVAAVGNDGPAAPPAYPASYPGVVAVTGVDGKGKALLEAGRAEHLDFAAPGADLAAATPGKGYARVRGTSFAAPLAAARLAARGSVAALADEVVAGRGRVGRGVLCASCAVAPRAVGAK
jgi:hypothetical protein